MKTRIVDPRSVMFDYTNYKGEQSARHVIPLHIVYGAVGPWYPEAQWLLYAHDLDRKATRTFAMDKVRGWVRPAPPLTQEQREAEINRAQIKVCENATRLIANLGTVWENETTGHLQEAVEHLRNLVAHYNADYGSVGGA